jgi:hypothetical protein
VVAEDEFLLLLECGLGSLDVGDVLIVFHDGLPVVVAVGRIDFFLEFLRDEEMIEEKQDCRDDGNLEP